MSYKIVIPTCWGDEVVVNEDDVPKEFACEGDCWQEIGEVSADYIRALPVTDFVERGFSKKLLIELDKLVDDKEPDDIKEFLEKHPPYNVNGEYPEEISYDN